MSQWPSEIDCECNFCNIIKNSYQTNNEWGFFVELVQVSWINAELVILTHGVVKSATLLISPMAFNIENIEKK